MSSQNKAKAMQKQLKQKEVRLPEAKRELAEVTQREMVARKERQAGRRQLEETKASLEASKSESLVVTKLLAEKSAGRIKGIMGRLGSLGAIDSKYDVAVTTACPALSNIVVESTSTGQRCVSYLRKNNLGRATFIMLDKLQYLADRMTKRVETPENVPRLFDLVRCKDPSLRVAFYYALKDTLVAETLEQAVRVSNHKGKRWRVVTLEGQLLEASGTMSGGGNRVLKGGMSSKLTSASAADTKMSAKEIKGAEADLARLEQE